LIATTRMTAAGVRHVSYWLVASLPNQQMPMNLQHINQASLGIGKNWSAFAAWRTTRWPHPRKKISGFRAFSLLQTDYAW